MKRIFTVGVALAALFFASCEPNEDIYDKLDDMKKPYSESISYVLISTDYTTASAAAKVDALDKADSTKADLIKTQLAFNSRFTANDYVGAVLAKNFPALKTGSAAVVTYNVNLEDISYLNDIAASTKYEVTADDYTSVGGSVEKVGYFIPSSPAVENIPNILTSAIASPTADQLALVTYKQSDIEPSTGGGPTVIDVDLLNENFESYLNKDTIKNDGWLNYIEQHTWWWLARVYNSNAYAQMGANSAPGPVVAWLVSPEIDLSTSTENTFSFDINVGYYNASCLSIFIMQNVDPSDIGAATKTDVTSNFTIPTTPTSGYGTFAAAGTMDLSAYTGKIRIGFKYSGDGANAQTTTYQVDNVLVKGKQTVKKAAKADLFNTFNDFYKFDGTKWSLSSSVIAVQPQEYDAMGAPGKYNNFSASEPASKYLPILLDQKFPFAQEGDKIVVAYNYFASNSTSLVAEEYRFEGGIWTSYKGIVSETSQFVYGRDKWVFDPTVTFTMSKPDYQLIVDWVKDVLNRPELIDRGNAEFYAGASAYYGNYDIRISKRAQWDPDTYSNLTDDEANALIWNRLNESLVVMLQKKFPNAVAQVSGVDVFYNVSFIVYDGISKTYTAKFQCTVDGSANEAPTFELISGPAVL